MSGYRGGQNRGTRVYIGNLSSRTREKDLERVFDRYGRILRVDLKNGFAFVEYESSSDADYAIRKLDGYEMDDRRWAVEAARGPRSRDAPESSSRGKPGRGGFGYRIRVEGLDNRTSWQDLKDFARKAGDVAFTDVWSDHGKKCGTIEYKTKEDFKEALRTLDDATLDGKRLRLIDDRSRSGSRDKSKSRSRSPGDRKRSRTRSRSPKRAGSRSPSPKPKSGDDEKEKAKSRSRSRSRSRSPPRGHADDPKDADIPSKANGDTGSPTRDGGGDD